MANPTPPEPVRPRKGRAFRGMSTPQDICDIAVAEWYHHYTGTEISRHKWHEYTIDVTELGQNGWHLEGPSGEVVIVEKRDEIRAAADGICAGMTAAEFGKDADARLALRGMNEDAAAGWGSHE